MILAAVIRNMAFETVAFRKEIRIFRGIEAMVKVSETDSAIARLDMLSLSWACSWQALPVGR